MSNENNNTYTTSSPRHKVQLGRSENIIFLGVDSNENIPAKIDTGAYRSAIHASNIKEESGILEFTILKGHPIFDRMKITMSTDDYKVVGISNSFGHREKRYEVKLKVKLGPKIFFGRFSLADRSKKLYPILIGRKILNGRFIVNTSEARVNRVELKTLYGIDFMADEEERQDN